MNRTAQLTPTLARREKEALKRISEGLTSQEVADRMGISKRTVDFYLESIYRKLGVKNRVSALAIARKRGWME